MKNNISAPAYFTNFWFGYWYSRARGLGRGAL